MAAAIRPMRQQFQEKYETVFPGKARSAFPGKLRRTKEAVLVKTVNRLGLASGAAHPRFDSLMRRFSSTPGRTLSPRISDCGASKQYKNCSPARIIDAL